MSLFDDGDAALLKKWVVGRLENISDADSDVLADYVLALLRHEQSENEVRQMCIDQLDDFLREHTSTFVNELFAALHSKSYISVNSTLHGGLIAASPPATSAPTVQSSNDDADSEGSYAPKSPDISSPVPFATQNNSSTNTFNSRKRGYYDRDAPGAQNQAGQYSSHSRTKNPKMHARGGGRGNHSGDPSNRWGRGGGDFNRNGNAGTQNGHLSQAPMPQAPFPLGMLPGAVGLPLGGPPLPFPTDPMAQLLAAQAVAAVQSGWNPLAMFQPPPDMLAQSENRLPKRGVCHSYEQKGYCRRGDSCPYLHANPLVVPPVKGQDEDEYDPNTPMLSPQELERRPSITFPAKPVLPSRGGGNQRGGRGGSNRGGRSELSGFGPPRESSKALVVECIPDDKLDEQSIHGYFVTFGPIESVEMRPEKKLAILKFENHEDARKAYNSPEPIFNNRFVKVYWLKADSEGQQNQLQSGDSQQQPDEMEIDMEDFQRKQTEAQKAYDEKQAKKKEIDDQAKRLDELRADLLRRQEEEKKKLLAKLAKKHALKEATNGASSNQEPNNKEAKTAQQTAALKAQLEALEAEATSLGIDHSKLDEPLPDFHPPSYSRGRGAFRARGGFGAYSTRGTYAPRGRAGGAFAAYRGRGRGAPMAKKMTLDNRTKTVMVNGVSDDGIETLQQYMLACGSQYTKLEKNPDADNSQLITFNTRGDAARFYHADPNVPRVGKIEVSWVEAEKSTNGTNGDSGDSHDADIELTDSNTENGGGNGNGIAANGLDHYDVYDMADDDDSRWT
ncbi:hypothetical protein TWF696_006958 [Orbilia brochopaga]|uniref:RNA-binding protein 26 n=1 Tax=Orbilia brochopaga TaxID=3140254 RepID=A0AAV9UTQ9_9PEZI